MRQVREVLRLTGAWALSDRRIAQRLRVSRPPSPSLCGGAQAAGLAWPLPDTLDDLALESRLCATVTKTPVARRPAPDWTTVPRERTRPGAQWSCCGRHTRESPPMASSTASAVTPIARGLASSLWACGKAPA
jgi:hypothetical protein